MKTIGVDIGLQGAIATLNEAGEVESIVDMPSFLMQGKRREHDPRGLWKIVREWVGQDVHVWLERPQSRPEATAASMLKVGEGWGIWEGLLVASALKYSVVWPQTWQAALYAGGVAQGKERSFLAVSRLHVDLEIPKSRPDRADAVLVATFGYRALRGQITQQWDEAIA